MEDIKEGNRLIAEFMGLTQLTVNIKSIGEVHGYSINGYDYDIHELLYSTSWDWLMPVVEKIESLGFLVTIEKLHYGEHRVFIARASTNSDILGNRDEVKIMAVYKSVVKFIKWHNTNGK